MSSTTPHVMTLEALRSVPLFASLDDIMTSELRGLLTAYEVSEGTPLFHADDAGDGMYLIESGRVRISVRDVDGKEITQLSLYSR